MKKLSFLNLVALLATSAFAALPPSKAVVDFDKGNGNVEFRAIGRPSALKIIGKGSAPHGRFTIVDKSVTGEARFSLNSLDTGIAMRTEHMKKKYLETEKYPEAKLTITKMELPQGLSAEKFSVDNVPFNGKLLLHGVENPVTGVAKVERAASNITIGAQFSLKIADYKIAQPSFAGITMADEVQIAVQSSAPLEARGATIAN